jgi:hypothetical protein
MAETPELNANTTGWLLKSRNLESMLLSIKLLGVWVHGGVFELFPPGLVTLAGAI